MDSKDGLKLTVRESGADRPTATVERRRGLAGFLARLRSSVSGVGVALWVAALVCTTGIAAFLTHRLSSKGAPSQAWSQWGQSLERPDTRPTLPYEGVLSAVPKGAQRRTGLSLLRDPEGVGDFRQQGASPARPPNATVGGEPASDGPAGSSSSQQASPEATGIPASGAEGLASRVERADSPGPGSNLSPPSAARLASSNRPGVMGASGGAAPSRPADGAVNDPAAARALDSALAMVSGRPAGRAPQGKGKGSRSVQREGPGAPGFNPLTKMPTGKPGSLTTLDPGVADAPPPPGGTSTLGQAHYIAQHDPNSGPTNEAIGHDSGLGFDGSTNRPGGVGGSELDVGHLGGSVQRGDPGMRPGQAVDGDSDSDAVPPVGKEKDVTPYQKLIELAQKLLMLVSVLIGVIFLLGLLIKAIALVAPHVALYAWYAARALQTVAVAAAAVVTVLGLMIMAQHGQFLQGAMFTVMGATLTYAAWHAMDGVARPEPEKAVLEQTKEGATTMAEEVAKSRVDGPLPKGPTVKPPPDGTSVPPVEGSPPSTPEIPAPPNEVATAKPIDVSTTLPEDKLNEFKELSKRLGHGGDLEHAPEEIIKARDNFWKNVDTPVNNPTNGTLPGNVEASTAPPPETTPAGNGVPPPEGTLVNPTTAVKPTFNPEDTWKNMAEFDARVMKEINGDEQLSRAFHPGSPAMKALVRREAEKRVRASGWTPTGGK